ncbi:hypothetical protein HJ590_17830 [Naumannella sp. ID2617S]|nr:hypothetical protein [Naumannella sp. ID2617S]
MRPELVRRIVAGYAIALTALALVLLPGRSREPVVGAPVSEAGVQTPATGPGTPTEPAPASAPVRTPAATPTASATPTHRTARTPEPSASVSATTTAPPSPAVQPVGTSADTPTAAPQPTQPTQSTTPSPTPEPRASASVGPSRSEGPPGPFAITSSNDLSSCNGGRTFPVTWSPSAGAVRYTVYASNQGSQTVTGTSATLSCPTQAGTFTVTVIAYNERMQGTNAPTVAYHEPVPLDDHTPSPTTGPVSTFGLAPAAATPR